MRIIAVEDFHASAGYRDCSFLKITTDEGIVGWSEFREEHGGRPIGLRHVIQRFGNQIMELGLDPRDVSKISMYMHAAIRHTAGGLNHQAIGAIENACLDIKAKALGVPVYALFGGAFRERIRAYWTHCGSFRVRLPDFYQKERGEAPIQSLDDLKAIAAHARSLGFTAIKTNPVYFDRKPPYMFNGGFKVEPGFLDRNGSNRYVGAVVDQMAAMREGLGAEADLMLDVAFSQRTEGYMRLAKALEPFALKWLEIDMADPEGLALIRRCSSTPVASLEAIYGLKDYRPYFQNYSVDVGIVDVIWNGLWQSVRIAGLADAFEVNVAPHNPVGDLGSYISAHFCAAVPNFAIMELRYDEAPWTADFVTHPIEFDRGEIVLHPERPGWGTDVNEEALRSRPPRTIKV